MKIVEIKEVKYRRRWKRLSDNGSLWSQVPLSFGLINAGPSEAELH
jgi:hypothetical protein